MTIPKNDLPHGWTKVTLGELSFKPQYGWTTRATSIKGTARLLRTTDLSRGQVEWEAVPYCEEEPNDLAKYLLEEGDIVISRAGSVGLSALIGPCPEAVFASYLIRFRLVGEGNSNYVYSFLHSSEYWEQISQEAAGIALQNVNAKKLALVSLPLPPLAEQHRIVAEIEKQLTRLDTSVAALRRARANLKRYRASVLKDACEGRLVPTEASLARAEGREYEHAGRLLQRIVEERRSMLVPNETRRNKYTETTHSNAGIRPELPEGWVWAYVGDVCNPINGRAFKPVEWSDKGTPIIRIQNLKNTGALFNYFIGDVEPKFHVETGDLLFAWSGTPGTSFGAHIWTGPAGALNQHIFNVRFNPNLIRPSFFREVLNQNVSEYVRQAQGGVGLAHITKPKFLGSMIPLPPLAEQERIVSEVERRLSVVQRAEATVDANLRRADRVRQSVLKRAFEGRLVPQDSDDEPATVLLKRIRAEREAAQASESRRGGGRRGRGRLSQGKERA